MEQVAFHPDIGWHELLSKVRRMPQEEREVVMSFVDRWAEEKAGQKTPWGVFLTNALPLGET